MKFSEWLNEQDKYKSYSVGDIITSDGKEPYTGDQQTPIKGKKYKLVQTPLSKFDYTRQDVYDNSDPEYKEEDDNDIANMKKNFDKLPPIPNEGDGLHRIVVAKELGKDTILQWIELKD